MNLNLESWKDWKKQLRSGEFADHEAYVSDKHTARVVMFKSAASIVEHFEKNFSFTGGSGAWSNTSNVLTGMEEIDEWKYGGDFVNHTQTAEALKAGRIAERYLSLLEIAKEELYSKFPALHQLRAIAISSRRRRKFSEDGDDVDIDRYMCGDPACFISMPKQQTRKKVARVYIDLDITAGHDSSEITSSFIEMIALVEIIELSGLSTEITVGFSTKNCYYAGTDKLYTVLACFAKEAHEPLDAVRFLSFAIPGFYRQFIFGTWNNLTNGVANGGCGGVVEDINLPLYDIFDADIRIKALGDSLKPLELQAVVNDILKLLKITEGVPA